MFFKRVTGVVLVALCGTFSTGMAHAQQARVFIERECPSAPGAKGQDKEAAALGAVLVAKVAGELVGAVIDSLATELSKTKEFTLTATERKPQWYQKPDQSGGYTISGDIGCAVIVIAKEFGPRNTNVGDAEVEKVWSAFDSKAELANELSSIKLRGLARTLGSLGVKAVPDFYLEARFATLTSGDVVFALDPKFVWYPKFLGEKAFLGPNTRDVLVKLEFSTPGDGGTFAQVEYSATDVTPADFVNRLAYRRMPWVKQPSTGSGKDGGAGLVPFNVKVLFTETAQPGKLGQILAKVANDSKATIVSEIENKAKLALSESERQAARKIAAEAASAALTGYVSAFDDFVTAQQATIAAQEASPPNPAAVKKAQNAEKLADLKRRNAEALASAAFADAGLPFTPLSN
jgi:hypothetical protein